MNAERRMGLLETLRRQSPFRAARTPMPADTTLQQLIIVGNGMVSHRLCAALVRLGAMNTYQVTVLGDEPYLAYDRVHLSRYVTGRDRTKLRLVPKAWYSEHHINLRTTEKAIVIDRQHRTVTTSDQNTYPYDRLILATGASPVLPPIPGLDRESAYVYRTISDLEAIKAAAASAKRVAILGGGLLGLEAAQALTELGLHAHIIENALYLMPRQLDAGGAQMLRTAVEALGIDVYTDKATIRVEKCSDGISLYFADDTNLVADMLVVAAGIRPRDELARDCGLACAPVGGIQVNDTLTTSDEAIVAIGDCISHHGKIYGLVGPGYEMAEVVAANLTGKRHTFRDANLSTRLKLLGVDVASLGDALQPGNPIVYRDTNCYRMLNLREEKVIGAIGAGQWDEVVYVQALIDKRARLGKKQIARFLETGTLMAPEKYVPVTAWPDEAIVCNCVGVTCGTLRAAAAGGANTRERICAETGASSVCGSCAPLVARLIDEPVTTTERNTPWKGLSGLSVIALIAALVFVSKSPYAYSVTIDSWWHDLESLWRNNLVKQASGYLLVGLTLIALLLPLRKRIPRFTLGRFPNWRLVHAVMGVACLVGLVAHTGFHMGANLNYALMLTFILLNAHEGGVAGTRRLESRGQGPLGLWARRWRRTMTALHIALFLPMPLLLALHVFAVYYF